MLKNSLILKLSNNTHRIKINSMIFKNNSLLHCVKTYHQCFDAMALPVSKHYKSCLCLVCRDYLVLSCQQHLVLFSKKMIDSFFKLLMKLKLNTAFLSNISFFTKTSYCFITKAISVFKKSDIITVKNILKLRILPSMYAVYMHFPQVIALCRILQSTTYAGKRYIKLLTIYQKPRENTIADAHHRHFTKGKYHLSVLQYIVYRGNRTIVSSTIAILPGENTICQSHHSYFTKVISLLSAQPYSNYLYKTAICNLNRWQSLLTSGFACHFTLYKPDLLIFKFY